MRDTTTSSHGIDSGDAVAADVALSILLNTKPLEQPATIQQCNPRHYGRFRPGSLSSSPPSRVDWTWTLCFDSHLY